MTHEDHAYHIAAAAWIEALGSFGERASVERAVTADVVIERWGFGPDAGRIVELIEGREAIARWAKLTNPVTEFELVGEVSVDRGTSPAEGVARYLVRVPEFEGGGGFRFALSDDGRIAHLAHRPDDLDDALPETAAHDDWRNIVARAKRRSGGVRPNIDLDEERGACAVHEH